MKPLARRVGAVVWPAFIGAAMLEVVVFAFVDPGTLVTPWDGALSLSSIAVYSLAFFVFWAAACAACLLTLVLARSEAEANAAGRSAFSGSER